MVQSVGVSRAYAVLRKLELLRQLDVLDPLPPDTDTDTGSTVSDAARGNCRPALASSPSMAARHAAEKWPRQDTSPITAPHTDSIGRKQKTADALWCDEAESTELLRLQEEIPTHSIDSPIVSDSCREPHMVQGYSYITTESATTGRRISQHPTVNGRNQALQRVLQEIVAMRKQASGKAGNSGQGDVYKCPQQLPCEVAGGVPCALSGGIRRALPRLMSPSPDVVEDEDVFFDELPLSLSTGARGTKRQEEGQRPEQRKRALTQYQHEFSPPDEEGASDDVSRTKATEEQASAVVPQRHSPTRRTKDAPTSSAVSEYTKSLLRQRQQCQGKPQVEIQQQRGDQQSKAVKPHTQSELTLSTTFFSPITRVANRNEDLSPLPSRGLDFESVQREVLNPPLGAYLQEMTIMGSAEMQEKLRGMEGCCDVSAVRCRDWFALTALANAHGAVRHVMLPLLLAELTERAESKEEGDSDANSRMSHILCALIGFGELAVSALSLLLEMLTNTLGCSRLVALAIRSVGGDEGLRALCRVARCDRLDSSVRAAAIYGISTLAYPVLGHTTVYCVGTPGLSDVAVFYQPPVPASYIEVGSNGERRREPSLQCPPPYRPTHIILSAELVRKQLIQFTVSRNFRRATSSYETLPLVLNDFAHDASEACLQQGIPDDVQEALRQCALELDVPHALPRVLPFSYDPHYVGREEELFSIEETLMTILHDRGTPLDVIEQTLVSIASLPDFATTHAASPVLDYVVHCVSRFEQRDGDALYGEEGVLVAGLVALGRLLRNEGTPPSVIDTACVVLLHNLSSPSCRLRHAACIGLGEVGSVSNKRGDIVRALTASLSDATMNHETVAWALTRLGLRGVRVLLDRIAPPLSAGAGGGRSSNGSNRPEINNDNRRHAAEVLPISTRIMCARALGKVEFLTISLGIHEDARRLQEELVRGLAAIIASAQLEEDVALECAYALGDAVGVGVDGGTPTPCRDEEAANYYRSEAPNEAFEVLKGLIEAVLLPLSVEKALFYALCLYGGAHGELYASQTAIQSSLVVLRAAAAFALRVSGGKVIRTVVMALNDDDASVRVEAFDTLDAVGVEAVLAVLRMRPHKHTHQVIAALRDCLLRDMGRETKRQAAQDLYAALVRA
ncbi:serine/arginine repetitive matrix protein 1 [Trypanosoma rangeli]|uniref:Serine/arginine repetitive matrix protein 1 n=1 Tax=Trypanosoma rangeli TaxID=5698 RepID=A0A3R7RKI8_TRYRA|nr:serine/arginine repetitive matrix protein 1 [Trypanosoma rangeli]RNF05996.1 serine/arginine repetitive matrix protein 1 [Trypanosoma rangeli]|eukprot:RNF05996.1 serine/arginine repetitive matrix protein 1 [Trypanosoma rangeli]